VGSALGLVTGKVRVWPGVPSLTGNGLISAVSDPIEDVDAMQFWFALLQVYRHPPVIPGVGFLRRATLEDVRPNGFTVKQVLDGELLDQIGKGEGTGENVEITYVHQTNKEDRSIKTVTYWKSGKVRSRNYVLLHHDPLRMESWYEIPGDPMPEDDVRARVQWVLTLIVQRNSTEALKDETEVRFESHSSPSGEERLFSERLDGHVTFDQLWEEWVDLVKYRPKDQVIKSSEVCVVSESEFVVVQELARAFPDTPGERSGNGEDSQIVQQVYLRKELNEICIEEWRDMSSHERGHIPTRLWVHFHRDPLQVECWGELPGERKADYFTQATMQAVVDMIIADPIHPGKMP